MGRTLNAGLKPMTQGIVEISGEDVDASPPRSGVSH